MANPFKAAGRGIKKLFGKGGGKSRSFSNQAGSATGEMRSERKDVELKRSSSMTAGAFGGHTAGAAEHRSKVAKVAAKPKPAARAAGAPGRRMNNQMGEVAPSYKGVEDRPPLDVTRNELGAPQRPPRPFVPSSQMPDKVRTDRKREARRSPSVTAGMNRR